MKQDGFTLIEIIVAIALFTIIVTGMVALWSNMFTVNRQQGDLLSDQDQTRKLTFRLMTELRNAQASNTGSYALAEASNQQLTFYSNIDGGNDIERLRYYVQNGRLMRGVVKPTGSPLTYNFGTETSTIVQNNLANGANAIFYYYNGSYDGVTDNPLSQPVSVASVRAVRASVQVFLRAGVTNTNSYTSTAIGTIRSLKTNLGD